MQEIILIKNGELALKGLNRSSFESVLAKNIKRRMHGLGKFVITRSQSTLTIEPQDDSFDMEEAVDRLSRVFGIAGFERAAAVEKSMDAILSAAPEYSHVQGRSEAVRQDVPADFPANQRRSGRQASGSFPAFACRCAPPGYYRHGRGARALRLYPRQPD